IDEGYKADIVILDPNKKWTVDKSNLKYKCNWSPLEGLEMTGNVESTIVSGHLAWHLGQFNEAQMGQRLLFQGK
ncbi:MAG: dihydroorotase, partial [Saprospiraceae bacterium]